MIGEALLLFATCFVGCYLGGRLALWLDDRRDKP